MSTVNIKKYSISSASLLSIGSITSGAMETRPFTVRRLLSFVSPIVLFVCWGSALAQTYKATELGLLPSGTSADAEAINNAGQVVGGADNPTFPTCVAAVIWNGTTPTSISCTPPFGGDAHAINNFGVVLYLVEPQIGSFVWSPKIYNMLGYDKFFLANGVNDSGRIVGTEGIPSGGPPSVALSWASPYATTWTVLSELPGNEGGGSFANGINNAGQIVGGSIFIYYPPSILNGTRHATLWSGAKVTDLGTLGGTESDAAAISDSGQIVGWADTPSGAQHAASWIGTKVTDLGTLGGTNSHANAVNTSGEIVGAADTASGAQHAALFTGGKVIDLNSALSSPLVHITLTEATGINDSGWIVANGVDSRTGLTLAFLLTSNVEVLNCLPDNYPIFKVVKPSNSVSSNVSPNSSGYPSICAIPSTEPPTWYIKTTTDGGATWQWKYMLEVLGLGELPSNLEVLNCVQGGNFYKVVEPSNSVSSNVSPNSAGHPSICAIPSSEPGTWYVKTTTDGGATWQWKYMLEALGLGK